MTKIVGSSDQDEIARQILILTLEMLVVPSFCCLRRACARAVRCLDRDAPGVLPRCWRILLPEEKALVLTLYEQATRAELRIIHDLPRPVPDDDDHLELMEAGEEIIWRYFAEEPENRRPLRRLWRRLGHAAAAGRPPVPQRHSENP